MNYYATIDELHNIRFWKSRRHIKLGIIKIISITWGLGLHTNYIACWLREWKQFPIVGIIGTLTLIFGLFIVRPAWKKIHNEELKKRNEIIDKIKQRFERDSLLEEIPNGTDTSNN